MVGRYIRKDVAPIHALSFFVSADFANRIMRRRGNPTGCDQATKLFGLDVRLIHGSSFSKKMDRCGWKSRGETRRRTAK